MKHAHETKDHILMKSVTFQRLVEAGFIVKAEEAYADLVAFKPGLPGICAIECERSVRNAIKNILRDLRSGASCVITIADYLITRDQIIRKAARVLPPEKKRLVSIICMSDPEAMDIAQTITNALKRANTEKKEARR
jgi:hypothetical protein